MRIGILDYGAGNLQSVRNALHSLGHDPVWIRDAQDMKKLGDSGDTQSAIVFPGQGEFRGCVESLQARGLWEPLRTWLTEDRPYLGICLGYQALFESSEEAPGVPGLDIFKGTVKRFTQDTLSGKATRNQERRRRCLQNPPHGLERD